MGWALLYTVYIANACLLYVHVYVALAVLEHTP